MNQITNEPFIKAAALNSATFSDYYTRLKLLAMSMFEWKNIPNDIPVHYLEETLYNQGRALFFRDPTKGLMILECSFQGNFNAYGEPIKARPMGVNYTNPKFYSLIDKECVVIRNNYLMEPTHKTIRLFCQRLYEVERTLDVNIKAQKYPVIVRTTKETELTLRNVYNSFDGNKPVIVVDKSLDINAFSVLDTKAPYVSDKLMLYKHDLWNEALSFLGISNSNQDKKERMITAEATSKQQMIELSAEVMLLCRKKACEEINAIFGTEISVEMRNQQPNVKNAENVTEGDIINE